MADDLETMKKQVQRDLERCESNIEKWELEKKKNQTLLKWINEQQNEN